MHSKAKFNHGGAPQKSCLQQGESGLERNSKSHPVRYLPSETNDSSTFHLEVSDEVFERANVKQPRRNAAKKLPSTGWANRIIRSFGSQPKRKSTKSNQRFRPKLSIPPQGNNPHAKARRRKEIFATRTLRLCAFA